MIDFDVKIKVKAIDEVTALVKRVGGVIDSMLPPLRRVKAEASKLGRATGISALAKEIERVGRSADKAGEGLLKLNKVAALKEIGKLGKQASDSAAEILRAAAKTGVGIEALQSLGFAAVQSGVSQETIVNGIMGLNSSIIGAATGSERLRGILQGLGLDVSQLRALKPEDRFIAVADAISKISDPALRVEAMEVFGTGAADLVPLVHKGGDGIKALMQQAREMGLVMGEDAVRGVDRFGRAVSLVDLVMQGFVNTVAGAILPVLAPLIESFAHFFAGAALAVKFFSVAVHLTTPGAAMLSRALGTVIMMVGRLGIALLTNPILAIIAAIAVGVLLIYQNWDGIAAWFGDKMNAVTSAFDEGFLQGVAALLTEFHPAMLLADAINEIVKAVFGVDLFAIGSEWLGGLLSAVEVAMVGVQNFFIDGINALIGFVNDLLDSTAVQTVLDLAGLAIAKFDEIARVPLPGENPGAGFAPGPGGLLPEGAFDSRGRTDVNLSIKVVGDGEVTQTRIRDSGNASTRLDVGYSGFVRGVN